MDFAADFCQRLHFYAKAKRGRFKNVRIQMTVEKQYFVVRKSKSHESRLEWIIEITTIIPHSNTSLHCLSYFPRLVRWHDNNNHHNPNTKNPQVLDWRKPLPVDSCYSRHNCADMLVDISDKHRACAHHEAPSKVDITGSDCYQEGGTSDADSCEYCQIFEVLPRIAS